MKPAQRFLAAAACMLCTGAAVASADGAGPARSGMFAASSVPFAKRLTPEQREEWRFLKDAAAAGRFENDAARMALAKSGDTQVRTLAATLVNQHAAAQGALQQMLHARNIAPPMFANEQRKVLNRLAKLQGAKFDREWMEAVALRAQQDDIQAFEKASQTVHDPQLRSWIVRTLPTLRWQLASAERAVAGSTKYAKLAPSVTTAAIKSPVAALPAAPNPGDLAEGNMLLGPTRPVAVKLTEPNTR
jgi:putative membrane protein